MYVVYDTSLTQAEWLREGYECLVANAPDTYFRGDFFLFDSGWRADGKHHWRTRILSQTCEVWW